ncbi:MAG: hypothetical protein EHM70_05610 [Chloroflexota bacterium]|nr:MAG: hypothetical protein EHM70_05610 [Chloroflexota bacterium]
MLEIVIDTLQTINQFLTAGIAITAFSLLLYAFTFNLRDRVARSFAIILICVVIVFVGDTIASTTISSPAMQFWQRIQWIGIVFLPSAYLQFSDALLATTGRPSRGRRRILVRLTYLVSLVFVLTLPFNLLVGPLVEDVKPAPHLQRTWLTWVFSVYYLGGMVWAWINFYRAHQRTVTSTSQRRMRYLLAGAVAPALGSYPYLLFGSGLAARHEFLFWFAATASNVIVYVLLVVMAYAVAFFGVPWPDRVVKRRLFKWLMRGPVAASVVLSLTVLARRAGEWFGTPYSAAVPIIMVASILVIEHLITLVAPIWERWLFHGGDQANMHLLQTLEERLLTSGDMRQFLESVLAAVCDRLQATNAFVVALGLQGMEMVVTIGNKGFLNDAPPADLLETVVKNGFGHGLFSWGGYWLVPLFAARGEEDERLLGLFGVARNPEGQIDDDQREDLFILARRAALALEDRSMQQNLFSSLEDLTPQMDLIQRMRAAASYDGTNVLTAPDEPLKYRDLSKWVKDALSHYWGGPKLTHSPLIKLKVVQQALNDHEGNPANALRAILNQAIENTRPEGERRFTGEWILYNILEMKFMEGRKVREIAMRLAMSEADLYRKQRIAIEAVANAIVEMEQKAEEEVAGEKI